MKVDEIMTLQIDDYLELTKLCKILNDNNIKHIKYHPYVKIMSDSEFNNSAYYTLTKKYRFQHLDSEEFFVLQSPNDNFRVDIFTLNFDFVEFVNISDSLGSPINSMMIPPKIFALINDLIDELKV